MNLDYDYHVINLPSILIPVLACHILFDCVRLTIGQTNLNSQRHSNAHLTTIVSFLKGHTLQYNLSQPTSTIFIETSNSFILQQKV